MQTSYIYSVSRVNALAQFLLSKTDVERLLVAEPGDDLHQALKETYLAPYIEHVSNEDFSLAIEQTLIDAKKLIHKIAPAGDMFRVLWVQYDIHNLRVFAKAKAVGYSFEECKQYLSDRGIYSPDYLFAQLENRALSSLQAGWQEAFDKAAALVSEAKIDEVDGVFDELYFSTSKVIADKANDSFIKEYYVNLVDLHNLKSRLRHLKNETVNFSPNFVAGGSITSDQLGTIEDVESAFARLGGADTWKEALDYLKTTGNFTKIDVTGSDYLITLAKKASYDMFSSSSLVLYYLKCRQAAANVRTIVVGKNSGMTTNDIRTNLSMAYVNE